MTAEEILTKLQGSFPGLVKAEAPVKDYPTWTVPAPSVRAVFERLRSEFSFDYLDMVTATDWSGPVSPRATRNPPRRPQLPRPRQPHQPPSPGTSLSWSTSFPRFRPGQGSACAVRYPGRSRLSPAFTGSLWLRTGRRGKCTTCSEYILTGTPT